MLKFRCSKWDALGRLALLALLGLPASAAHAGLFDGLFETKPDYPVTTSDLLFGRQIGVQRIAWIDNDKVILPARAVQREEGPDGQEKLSSTPLGVYIWDVKKNTHIRHSDLAPFMWRMHYDHGDIAYSTHRLEPENPSKTLFTFQVGKLGDEKSMVLDLAKGGIRPELEPSMGPGKRFRDRGDINSLEFDLLPQHGYILVGRNPPGVRSISPGDSRSPVKLYRPDRSQPIELPILATEMYTGVEFSYSDYLDKYVVIPSHSRKKLNNSMPDWAADEGVPIYLISPEGQVDVVEIPPGYWRPHQVFPTREGLFWVSNDTRHGSKDAGGWLLKDGKVTKLFDQLVDGAGVSPDGCTIVYAGNDFNPKTTDYVQALDLCAARK